MNKVYFKAKHVQKKVYLEGRFKKKCIFPNKCHSSYSLFFFLVPPLPPHQQGNNIFKEYRSLGHRRTFIYSPLIADRAEPEMARLGKDSNNTVGICHRLSNS